MGTIILWALLSIVVISFATSFYKAIMRGQSLEADRAAAGELYDEPLFDDEVE